MLSEAKHLDISLILNMTDKIFQYDSLDISPFLKA